MDIIIIFYIIAGLAFIGIVANIVTTFKQHTAFLKLLREAYLKISDIKIKEIEYKHPSK